ncbi:MAG TPA: 6,7-dimethyl-8-ribityllumazine synthase [Vicinamibacterales bacterium]|nr:6,7-dimethyl-8-ribityllumazine synthase [Vicinamibacterales bacterium]
MRIAVVVARFNDFVTTRLRDGALAQLREAGLDDDAVRVFDVPGAFEVPQMARRLADSGHYDGVVCLGCLIRGATPHFDYIASAVAHGITMAAIDSGVPMSFGVLTTNSAEEALERAVEGPSNKGREAAQAVVDMVRAYEAMQP